jgi:2-dehydropantoate 2-reductase
VNWDGEITPRLETLHKLLLDFEPNAITTTNIWGFLWGKLAYGAQLFATALTNEGIADCLADPRYQNVYIAVAQEVLTVAAAEGVQPEAFNGFKPGCVSSRRCPGAVAALAGGDGGF